LEWNNRVVSEKNIAALSEASNEEIFENKIRKVKIRYERGFS